MTGFFRRRRLRKQIETLVHHARTFLALRRDVMDPQDVAVLSAAIDAAVRVRRGCELADLVAAAEALDHELVRLRPPARHDAWRENFDVLVVALSVAMCFRAYLYQPFKIPTGSMQPTLYGIHSCEKAVPAWYNRQPLTFARWLATGEAYHDVRAKASGGVQILQDSRKPGYAEIRIAGVAHFVPVDALRDRRAVAFRFDASGQPRAVAGDRLWAGTVTSGDFVFVNRWLWNFRHPRRGEVMVFSTKGIAGLQPGTHYIKRMCGLPNETLSIQPPFLLADGRVVADPPRMVLIAAKEKLADWAPPYAGFNPAQSQPCSREGLARAGDTVTLGPSSYYAMGDNSFNSYDSRYWGSVPERNLLGPAAFVHWPFTSPRWGRIH